ncbi:MAG: thiolase family protein [Sphingomonadales bacterium]|nr:thiolase family protein [Sphingomonadales bacterium]
MHEVVVLGVGIHRFGRFPGKSAIDMGAEAVRSALADAGVTWKDVQFAFGGSFEVDNPDAVVGRLGRTGIPFMDVYNGCATAATALELTADGIRSGKYEIGVAVGMDKHDSGAFTSDPVHYGAPSWYGAAGLFLTTKFFGMKINRYMHDHGISHETLARVAAKNYANGVLNPNAFRRKALSEDQIMASPMLNYPLRHYMFCTPDEGAAAVVLCRADVARKYTRDPLFLRATALRTRTAGAYEVHSSSAFVDGDVAPTVYASRAAYEQAGIGPEDVDVVQLQDTDSGAEVIHMAENGFCKDGEQERMLADGDTRIGGRLPINTDGGLIANGEPIGASGLRQVHEIVQQLRGLAGERQISGSPKVGYGQLYGAPGTAGVSIISK